MTTNLIRKVHHVAYRCKDAKQTVEWYGKYLGMKFILAIAEDAVPSTGEADPYMHVFLDAGSGNILAFFELPTRPEMGRDPNTPAWTQHLALEVASMEELLLGQGAGSKPTASRWSARPTTRCSSRSTSSIRAAIVSSWPATPTRRKCCGASTRSSGT
jgi:catechol 2,3-dioxygenase-like lactoylglutathione lyase family enzyme